MDYFVDLSMKASSWFNRIFKPSPFYSKRLPDRKILLRNRTLEELENSLSKYLSQTWRYKNKRIFKGPFIVKRTASLTHLLCISSYHAHQ